MVIHDFVFLFVSSRRRHTRCALVTGVRRVLFRSVRNNWAAAPNRLGCWRDGRSGTGRGTDMVAAVAKDDAGRPAESPAGPQAPASWRARISWAFFDWANQPYFTVITTFIFAPYFTARVIGDPIEGQSLWGRSEEHTSELQSLMRISYAVFCLKKKQNLNTRA